MRAWVKCRPARTLKHQPVRLRLTVLTRECEDIAGPDVIVAHRLLKNSISERGGCRAYIFFTDACRQRLLGVALRAHTETYPALGEASGGVYDLTASLLERREARREYVEPGDADFAMSGDAPVSPAVLWQYFVDTDKRLRWQTNMTAIIDTPNARGRFAAGASSHCAHGSGDILRHYVDWRPYDYFTNIATPVKNTRASPSSRRRSSARAATAERWSSSVCACAIAAGGLASCSRCTSR